MISRLRFWLALLIVGVCQFLWQPASEPFFNGDETRHVMTGAFVRDAILEGGITHPKSYAEQYYAQHPALGLLIWPPGFYAVEGLTMLVCGPTFEVGRCLVFVYFCIAAAYLYALVKRTHGDDTAFVSVLVFGLCRIVFTHAGVVMLEVPMLACVLGAMYHLERFLYRPPLIIDLTPPSLLGKGAGGLGENLNPTPTPSLLGKGAGGLGSSRLHLFLLGLWTLATVLHRYDAVLIIPYFFFRLLLDRQLGLLVRRDVIITATLVAIIAAPFWYLMVREIGGVQSQAATSGTNSSVSTGLFHLENVLFYPYTVWFQFGIVAALFIVMGLVRSFFARNRARSTPYWSLVAAVYLTFTPLAELEPRHALAWAPALALFAAEAALAFRNQWCRLAFVALLVGSVAVWTLKQDRNWIFGYGAAAKFCVAQMDGDNPVLLFDGLNDGNFIYQVRSLDPKRKLWVLRGDKLTYAMKSDPDAGYVEWAKDEASILKILHDADPAFVVVEDPPAKPEKYAKMPAAAMLRKVLREHPEQYRMETSIAVENGNQPFYDGVNLVIYRKLIRNPNRGPLTVKMFWQGTGITAPLPSSK